MSETLIPTNAVRGGEFLVKETKPSEIFIPEEFNEEQEMIRETVRDFIETRVFPNTEKIERQEDNISVKLMDELAELGLFGAHMPTSLGGMELDTNTNTLIAESFGSAGSFSVSFSAHTGIGMLPILYFGTEAQKNKYLPLLTEGKLKA